MAILNVVVAAGIWQPTETLLASINTALAAVLSLFPHGADPAQEHRPTRPPRLRLNPPAGTGPTPADIGVRADWPPAQLPPSAWDWREPASADELGTKFSQR
ncbi:MAG TPA: hypothetical protein VNF47_06910 [Streptosporangiaceae bacterium]|nr:hypothetical protein [Streptosporangiaceae bacterium]